MSSVIINSDSLFYYKVRQLLQSATIITKCDRTTWKFLKFVISKHPARRDQRRGRDFLHDYREFSITLIERGYITKLPSKTDHPSLPSNSTSLKEEHVQWSSILQETLRTWKCTVTLSLNRRNRSLTDPETTVGTCHPPTPCFVKGLCKPPQYSSCKTAAVDNPKNTLALTFQAHLRQTLRPAREWIRNCQQVSYHKEISSMLSKSTPRKPLVRQLLLFLDDTGVIRFGKRVHNELVSKSIKFLLLRHKCHAC